MDTLRGLFGDHPEAEAYDPGEEEIGLEAPPPAIGADERRMQVRAYNHWASLLGDRRFPLITDLETGSLPDFDPHAVLLDFAEGVENPLVRYIGSALAAEAEGDLSAVRNLADVPGRSLLSRITDHYLQIVANEAPIGFEAEFVNQRGCAVLYRGILLPFSASPESDTIDQIYGVINWKELADQQTTDALMREIDKALQIRSPRTRMPLVAWADGPADPAPAFAAENLAPGDFGAGFSSPDVLDLAELGGEYDAGMGLADLLASARELALAAQGAQDRSRAALYAAIGRAHDFALASADCPEDLAELIEDAGLKMQLRAPLIPVLKLVFGLDYDKTRLTEYATVIGHAQRIGLAPGMLGAFLSAEPGGLKGIVQLERQLRRAEAGLAGNGGHASREALARRLRALPTRPLATLPAEGEEFTLVLARRTGGGEVVLIGEVGDDAALIERAARRIAG